MKEKINKRRSSNVSTREEPVITIVRLDGAYHPFLTRGKGMLSMIFSSTVAGTAWMAIRQHQASSSFETDTTNAMELPTREELTGHTSQE